MLVATLDVLLPTDCAGCGAPRWGQGSRSLCQDCYAELPGFPWAMQRIPEHCRSAWFFGTYEGSLGGLVRRAKYRPDPSAMRDVVRVLGPRVRGRLPDVDVVVPVPQSLRGSLQRGSNPVRLLASGLARALGLPLDEPLVRRVERQQAGLDAGERLMNARASYRCERLLEGQRVLLVDDVVTTGSTAAACATELMGAGAAQVHLFALCDARA